MVNKNLLLIGILVIFVSISYLLLSNKSSFYQKTETLDNTTSEKNIKEPKKSFSIVLKNENQDRDGGIAVFEEMGDKTKITIRLIDAVISMPQEAFIYAGTCDALGENIFSLTKLTNGSSETNLGLNFVSFQKTMPMALVIYKPNTETTINSCSNI